MPYATYRFNKIIAAETIRFIVTVAIVVYKGLKLVVYRMLTNGNPTRSNLVLVTKAARNRPFDLEELKPLNNLKLKDILK